MVMEPQQTLIRYPPSNNSLLSSGNTKKSITYEPRTETISPAINDDIIQTEDNDSKSTKDEQTLLVEKLKKVEAEIIQTDLQIVRLRRQKEQLEQAANSASRDDDDQENVCENTKQLSIAKLVYHENRAKAQKAYAKLECLGGTQKDLPLYNQPSDNAIYHHNAAKFTSSFKSALVACFRLRLQNRVKLEESVSFEYDRRMEKWLKSIEIEDSQPAKRIRDAKTREFFEKQFPELKKARESGERFSRVGQRVARSDAEFDELLDGITEREDQDKKVKSYAVIPPMLEEMRSRKPKYINTNGYVEDIVAQYKEYQILNTWADDEKDIFRENYLQHPKDFGLIARMTSRKNVANCVQYYYLSKKSENYKQLLKRQQKRRTRSFVRPAAATPANPNIETNNDTTNNGKSVNGVNDKQAGDSSAAAQNLSEHNDSIKQSAQSERADLGRSGLQAYDGSNELNSLTCCICNCNFGDNQYRNVTRSNHQLYGIGLDTLKPGMKICYPCRFRHVRHPSFDEPSLSPVPMEHEDELNQMNHTMMELDTPVIKAEPEPVIENNNASENNKLSIPLKPNSPSKELPPDQLSGPNNGELNKGPQRTCVRDIIYQAIEMSFQKPKANEPPLDPKPDLPTRPECATINPALSQHSISNILPNMKQVGTNHSLPSNPLPSHLPLQNLTLDQHQQLQAEIQQQKQRQQLLEYNLRQHQLQVQMQQQRQYRQQFHLPPITSQSSQQSQLSQQPLPPRHPSQLQLGPPHPTQAVPMRHGPPPPPPPKLAQQQQPPLHVPLSQAASHPMLNPQGPQQGQPQPPLPPSSQQPPPPSQAIVPSNHPSSAIPPPPPPATRPSITPPHQPVTPALAGHPGAAGVPVAHPLNLCRKYSEPVYLQEPAKPQQSGKVQRPPMAHGVRGHEAAAPQSKAVSEDCVLNLSAKPPSMEPGRAADESRPSPNSSASPTSPSEMVIDESAGVVSPASSSDHQETSQ